MIEEENNLDQEQIKLLAHLKVSSQKAAATVKVVDEGIKKDAENINFGCEAEFL